MFYKGVSSWANGDEILNWKGKGWRTKIIFSPFHWKNWIFYRDNKMSINCKFYRLLSREQIFPDFSKGNKMSVKWCLQVFHKVFLMDVYQLWLWKVCKFYLLNRVRNDWVLSREDSFYRLTKKLWKIFINFTFMILSSYFIPVIHCHLLFNSFLSFCPHNRLILRLGYGLWLLMQRALSLLTLR